MSSEKRPTPIQEEIRQTRPFQSRSQEAAVAVLRTADMVRRHFQEAVEPHGLTLQQYNVLRVLRGARGDALPTLDIADRLIERAPGITRLLDRLEQKELVRRVRSEEDRRLVLCSITDAGLNLLAELDDVVDRADHEAMAGADDADLESLLELLDRVREGLR